MRIIAGSRKGARIAAPKGLDTRPTGDRVREAVFNLVGPVDGAEVLDLYAGSGAMGLEALSRGAERVTFVESDREAAETILRNLDKLKLEGAVVLREDAGRKLAADAAGGRRYDLVLIDPPYAHAGTHASDLGRLPSRRRGGERHRRGRVGLARGARPAAPEADEPPLRLGAGHGLRGAAMSDSQPVTCICPGSYDPVTLGHLDIIRRAAGIFERVIVGVVRDPQHKATMFSVEERVGFIAEALSDVPNVQVEVFSDLVVEFARRFGARTMVKGLRAISDFEWEFQMHHLNRKLAPEVETMYLMSSPQYSFLSSCGVKEVASFGGNVDDLVPEQVARRFRELFPQGKPGAPVSPQE